MPFKVADPRILAPAALAINAFSGHRKEQGPQRANEWGPCRENIGGEYKTLRHLPFITIARPRPVTFFLRTHAEVKKPNATPPYTGPTVNVARLSGRRFHHGINSSVPSARRI